MMNKTEEKAYEWLKTQGYHNITFRQRETPDFTTQEGKFFEIKKARNNVVWFTKGQRDKLAKLSDKIVVLIFDDSPAPLETVLFKELNTGNLYWKQYKILFQEDLLGNNYMRDMPIITIHLYPADKEALKHLAENQGMQLTTFCRVTLLKLIKENK